MAAVSFEAGDLAGAVTSAPVPPAPQGRFREIQYATAVGRRGRSIRWVPERRFHPEIPQATVERRWYELLIACPGRSWRLVQVGGEPLVERGPTDPVPGQPWGTPPGSYSAPVSPMTFYRIKSPEAIAAEERREGAARVLPILRRALAAGTISLADGAPAAMISGRPLEGRANAVLPAGDEPRPSATRAASQPSPARFAPVDRLRLPPLVSASWLALLSSLAPEPPSTRSTSARRVNRSASSSRTENSPPGSV